MNLFVRPSLSADAQRLSDAGVGQREVLEGQKAFGALLRPHHGPAATPTSTAEVPAPPEGRMRSSRPLAFVTPPPQLFTAKTSFVPLKN